MEYTGERYIPSSIKSMVITLEHWHRYILAKPYVEGKNILDIACGSGYGTYLLSKVAKNVTGGDIDSINVEYCNENYSSDNLTFDVQNIAKLSYPDDSFDVVTCFETIEHVDEETQILAIKEIRRVLKDDGVLIISTPNIDSKHYQDVDNEFHIKELTNIEFRRLINEEFKKVDVFSQFQSSCSFILPENGNLENHDRVKISQQYEHKKINSDCKIQDVDYLEGKFFIAVCSNGETATNSASSILLDDENELYGEYNQYTASIKEHLAKKDEIIDNGAVYIKSLEDEVSNLRNYIKAKDAKIEECTSYARTIELELDKIKKEYGKLLSENNS